MSLWRFWIYGGIAGDDGAAVSGDLDVCIVRVCEFEFDCDPDWRDWGAGTEPEAGSGAVGVAGGGGGIDGEFYVGVYCGDPALIHEARAFLQGRTYLRPQIGVVLGSGLGAFADELTERTEIPYAEIPGFPRSTAVGHAGKLIIGSLDKIPVAVMAGRVHLYEGYSGCRSFVRRAGSWDCSGCGIWCSRTRRAGLARILQEGSLVLICDHINLQGQNPLTGPNDETIGPRFPDMTEPYSLRLRAMAQQAAAGMGLHSA